MGDAQACDDPRHRARSDRREQWKSLRAEEQFDALLYLGPETAMTRSRWLPSLCADTAYMNMRLKRIAVAGIPPAEAERLKKYCSEVASK